MPECEGARDANGMSLGESRAGEGHTNKRVTVGSKFKPETRRA